MNEMQQRIAAQIAGGKKLGQILWQLLEISKPGVSLMSIETKAQELIRKAGGTPSFQTVQGYQWATCLCINDDVVHGIPTEYILEDGDVLTVDVGILYQDYHTDTAWTKIVENPKTHIERQPLVEKFLKTGEQALWEAIDQARAGNHIGHISHTIQSSIEGAGYSVVKSLVGHTVGRQLHEKPQVPGYLRGKVELTPVLTPGMTLAIEIIYAEGRGDIAYANDDGWTLTTQDGSLSAVFEHTILVTDTAPQVLTSWEK